MKTTLGGDFSNYECSYQHPWFEPAFIGADGPLVKNLSDSLRTVTGQTPVISTISKQDSFVLTNHANIPTVSYGPARGAGVCTYHQPDENVDIDAAWNCCLTVYDTVLKWIGGDGSWKT